MRVARAKTAVPLPPQGLVTRPRLLARLDAGAEAGTTLVCAPPGYGKTVLLADWARAPGPVTAWVNVDHDDGDPRRLWTAVLAAFAQCQGVPGDSALLRLCAPPPDAEPEFVAELADAVDMLPFPLRLVLDDVDEITGSRGLRSVERLVRLRPAGLHVVLSGRADPPLPLARLRLAGRLADLRATDLGFTPAEAAAVLTAFDVHLTPAQAELLVRRTEGWVAGLRLAAVSLRLAPDVDQALADFSGEERAVADYLVGVVLSRLPDETVDLLSTVSICDSVPAGLAALLSDRPDAGERLAALERETALVGRNGGDEFRVHALLHSYLYGELVRRRPGQLPRLHAAAGRWWADHDRPLESLRHAVGGRDPERIVTLLHTRGLRLLLAGEHTALRRALQELPAGTVRDDPWLAALAGVLACAGTVPATAAGETAALQELVELAEHPTDPAVVALARFGTGAGLVREDGDRAEADRVLGAALRLARQRGFDYLEMQCAALLAALAAVAGDEPAMSSWAAAAAGPAAEHGWHHTPWAAMADVVQAYAALLRFEAREARRIARRALRAAGPAMDPGLRFVLEAVAAVAALDADPRPERLEAMRQARSDLGDASVAPVYAAMAGLLELRAALLVDRPVAAAGVLQWLTGRVGAAAEVQIARAWEHASAGRTGAARRALRAFQTSAETRLMPCSVVDALVLEAELALGGGNRPAARRALASALERAAPLGLLRPFALASAGVRELLMQQIGGFGAVDPFARRALAARPPQAHGDEVSGRLSARERAVLGLLPSPMSLEEIAEELGVSINTVKSHTRAIYAKLGVGTRRAAVLTGNERGLVTIGGR